MSPLSRCAALCLASALVLSACGNDDTASPGMAAGKQVITGMWKKRTGSGVAPEEISRAQLVAFNSPMILASIEGGVRLYLVPIAQNGNVETWSTTDDRTLSFRDGVLVATRGLGPDIMQASVPSRAQLQIDGGKHSRSYYYLDGNDKSQRVDFDCSVQDLGMDQIVVVAMQHTARHMKESCTGNGGIFANEYWFESGGKVRKSKELIGTGVGYGEISRIVDKP